MKCRRHASITAIQDAYKESSFSFRTIKKFNVLREIKNLDRKKGIHYDDIPV